MKTLEEIRKQASEKAAEILAMRKALAAAEKEHAKLVKEAEEALRAELAGALSKPGPKSKKADQTINGPCTVELLPSVQQVEETS